jgi:hypothetical protein
MALFTLEALVLRGSVLRDVVALDLRLATSGNAGTQAPEVAVIPVQHPWPAPADDGVADTATGAGRSLRTDVLRHTSPARTAGATLIRGWPIQGGPAPAAAMLPSRIPAGASAPASEVRSRRPVRLFNALPEGNYQPFGMRCSTTGPVHRSVDKPATRTPPGSMTWERGEW